MLPLLAPSLRGGGGLAVPRRAGRGRAGLPGSLPTNPASGRAELPVALLAMLLGNCQNFRVWGRTMPLKEPSYAATQTARHPG